ncbi:MAG: hypothetical protein WBA55_04640 [Allopontixanthobacter sediminis]
MAKGILAKIVLVAAASSIPAVLHGQENIPEITVEGTRATLPDATQSVRAIANATNGNLARYEVGVCPGVAGLPRALANGIVDEMRADISNAGVKLAPKGCSANLTVIVTDSGSELIEELSKSSRDLFDTLSGRDIHLLKASSGPAWWWHTVQPRRADGGPVAQSDSGGPEAYTVKGATMSRLSSSVRQDITSGIVVLEVGALDGLTVRQIAGFAVMRGLSSTRNRQTDRFGYETILSLFEGSGAVAEMTGFDRAYLSALYSGSNGFTFDQKTRQIAQKVAAEAE